MTILSLIAAIDENYGIGINNKLLCHLPADLAHFKSCTLGKPIIMGRKTFESIGKPLPGRTNIVLSKHTQTIEGVITATSLTDALNLMQQVNEVMIIGGSKVFAEALPLADKLYLTLIHHTFDADVFFPAIDKQYWTETECIYKTADEANPYAMSFYTYQKIHD